jgi:hypothetical protein
MPGATLTTMDQALKYMYLPKLQSNINDNAILLKHIERETGMTSATGRSAVQPINLRPSEALGARGDGGALPKPQNQTYYDSIIPYAYLYGTIGVTHPSIVQTASKEGAWIKVVSSEMAGLTRDARIDMNRQLFGYGLGILGSLPSALSSSTSMTVYSGHNIKVGMVIDGWSALTSGTKSIDSVTVTGVSGNTITLGTSSSLAQYGYITREDSAVFSGASSVCYEMMGLMGIVDDASLSPGIGPFVSTLQGISRSTYPEWNAQIYENSTANVGRQITPALLDQALIEAQAVTGEKINLGITSPTQFRKIGNLMVGDRRYTDTMELAGGFTGIKWAGVPIVFDPICPVDVNGNDMLFFLSTKHLTRFELQDWDWDDTDGAVLHRNSGYATYEATLFYYGNLGTDWPKSNVCIRDLSKA